MAPGDIVKPLGSCAGRPGNVRCETAIILKKTGRNFKINKGTWENVYDAMCPCGTWTVHATALEQA